MNTKRSLLVLLIPILMMTSLFAQSRPFPYKLKNRDLWVLPLGVGMSSLGESLCENYDPITLEEIRTLDRNDVNAFDRSATHNWSFEWDERSDQYRDIVVISSLFLLSVPPVFHAKLSDTFTVATMFLESYFFIKGVTLLTKAAVGRKRPYVYNTTLGAEERQAIGSDDAFFSFFSGHVAAAFTAATFTSKVFTDIHGNSIWSKLLWGTSLSIAALTGYARVKAGEHYPSDVIVGAAVGFAIGYLVPTLHKKERGDRLSVHVSPNRIYLRLQL